MRILDVINRTTPFFEKHGVDSPRLTIELLLAHLLQKKRLELYLQFERELDESTLAKLRDLVRRRAAGEPLQYIVGDTEFCGLKFLVDRRVLIPRPETELLVATVVQRLAGHAAPNIIDVGTGSGCIAIALANKLPTAEILAVEASREALEVARANGARHAAAKKVRFSQADLLENLPDSLRADAVVSNPPYIATGELAKLPKEVRDFEPYQALVAGADGLAVIRRLATSAAATLAPTGFLALEIGAGQRPAVEKIFTQADWEVKQVVKDLQGHERVIVAQPRT